MDCSTLWSAGTSYSGWLIWIGEWKASPKAITRCPPALITKAACPA
ncbi:hypothetical protein ACQP2T_41520 [Nonomuraea sp. CA-143628]